MTPRAVVCLLVVGLVVGLVPAATTAATCDNWTGGAGDGLWSSSGNWSAGVPGSGTDACIELSGTYTVTVQGGQSAASLTLGGSSGAQTLDIVGTSTAADAVLSLSANSTIMSNGHVILDSQNSSGLAELTYSGSSSTTLTNDGTIDAQVEAGADYLGLSLDNAGTVEVKSGELNWNTSTTLTNSGTVTVDSGATFASTNGGASVVNDAGGSVANNGSLSVDAGSWAQDGGSESGSPVQLISSTYSDTGTSAAGSFDTTGTATISGTIGQNETLSVVGRPSQNSSADIAAGGATNDGTIVLDSQNAGGFAMLGGSAGATWTNNGTIDAQVEGTGNGDYLGLSVDNAGTIEVKTGELNWNTGSTTLTNSGTVQVDSGATFASTSGAGSVVNDAGGSVVNNGSLTADNGSWAQDGGSESGNPVQLAGATYSDTGSSAAGSFDTTGTATISGTIGPHETLSVVGRTSQDASTYIAAGGVTNDGTIVLDSQNGGGFAMLGASGEPAGATWTNNGTIDAQVEGTGNGDYVATDLNNAGTVEVKSGALQLQCCNLTANNTGDVAIDAGATFASTSGGNKVDLQSTGTLTVHVASSSSYGTLTSVGSSQVNLSGTLAVSFDGGFSPTTSDSFPIISASGTNVTSGGFSQLTPGVAPGGLAIAPQYSGTGNGVSLTFETPALAASTGAQSTPAGTPFGQDLKATVTDAQGPVSGAMVTFTAPSSGPSGTFPGGVTQVTESTDSTGVATAPAFTANASPGSYTVTASVPAAPATAGFSLTNLSPGRPGVSLSAASLDFGSVGLGATSATQTVTVTNTGQGPLSISSAAITGADAGDFHASGDSCSGQSIAGGKQCSVSIEFGPTASGARAATLAFTDNAPGSPQSLPLQGAGTTLGSVTGTIYNGVVTGAPPALGAEVAICPTTFLTSACQSQSSAYGTYAFSGLTPGTWYMQVNPHSANLFPASAIVTVPRGSVTQNFTLEAPAPIPPGVTLTGVFGGSSGGVPVIPWGGAFTVTYPPDFPSEATGTTIVYITIVGVYPAESDNTNPLTSGTMLTVVGYPAGKPVVEAQYADPTSGAEPTITYTNSPPPASASATAGSGGGIVVQYLPTSGEIQADIALHAQLHGPLQIYVERAWATYSPSSASPARRGSQTRPGSAVDAQLGPNSPSGYYQDSPPTGPVIDAPPPEPIHVPQGQPCPPGYARPSFGPSPGFGGDGVRGPKPATRPLQSPVGGGGGGDLDYDDCYKIGGYADPSGLVLTTGGAPVPAATVQLLSAHTGSGPFAAVPNGSVIMSPSNRRDPDRTNALGLFGWDVLPGYYRVSARHPGCTAPSGGRTAQTRVYSIPPPVANLRLKLRCPSLHRGRSRLTLRVRAFPHGSTVVVATVVGRHPSGAVAFTAGKLHLTLPLDPRTHRATLETPRSAGRVTARYLGDGYNQPSSRRSKL